MDLPTYTNIWRIEKRLYKLYDVRLPAPLPINLIVVFAGITIPYIFILYMIGVPLSHTLVWLYVLPPGVLTWLTTRPVIEGKRLPELVESQVRYLAEPRTWCRLGPLEEKDQMAVNARVWQSRRAPKPAEQPAEAAAKTAAEKAAPVSSAAPRMRGRLVRRDELTRQTRLVPGAAALGAATPGAATPGTVTPGTGSPAAGPGVPVSVPGTAASAAAPARPRPAVFRPGGRTRGSGTRPTLPGAGPDPATLAGRPAGRAPTLPPAPSGPPPAVPAPFSQVPAAPWPAQAPASVPASPARPAASVPSGPVPSGSASSGSAPSGPPAWPSAPAGALPGVARRPAAPAPLGRAAAPVNAALPPHATPDVNPAGTRARSGAPASVPAPPPAVARSAAAPSAAAPSEKPTRTDAPPAVGEKPTRTDAVAPTGPEKRQEKRADTPAEERSGRRPEKPTRSDAVIPVAGEKPVRSGPTWPDHPARRDDAPAAEKPTRVDPPAPAAPGLAPAPAAASAASAASAGAGMETGQEPRPEKTAVPDSEPVRVRGDGTSRLEVSHNETAERPSAPRSAPARTWPFPPTPARPVAPVPDPAPAPAAPSSSAEPGSPFGPVIPRKPATPAGPVIPNGSTGPAGPVVPAADKDGDGQEPSRRRINPLATALAVISDGPLLGTSAQAPPADAPAGVPAPPADAGTSAPAPAAPVEASAPAPAAPRAEAPSATPTIERALSGKSRDRNLSWRGTVKVVTGKTQGPGARDQEALDRARARLPMKSAKRILMLGCTSGAGQTVTTLMTGHILASLREEPVAAVDLNDGGLARFTAPAARLEEVLKGQPPQRQTNPRPDGLSLSAKGSQARLDVVASDGSLADGDELKMAVQLGRHYPLTLLDPGAQGLTRLLKVADQLVIVVPASVEAAGALADTREWLDAHGFGELVAHSVTLVNGVSRRSLADVEAAESVARGRCRAIVRVPWDEMLPVGVAGPSTLRPQTRVAYTALAGVLVAGMAAAPVRTKK